MSLGWNLDFIVCRLSLANSCGYFRYLDPSFRSFFMKFRCNLLSRMNTVISQSDQNVHVHKYNPLNCMCVCRPDMKENNFVLTCITSFVNQDNLTSYSDRLFFKQKKQKKLTKLKIQLVQLLLRFRGLLNQRISSGPAHERGTRTCSEMNISS